MRIDSECVSASDSIESLPSVTACPIQRDKEEIDLSDSISVPVKPSKSSPDSDWKRSSRSSTRKESDSIGTEALEELHVQILSQWSDEENIVKKP